MKKRNLEIQFTLRLQKLIKFCKHLMETFLAIVIKLYSLNSVEDEISNAFNVIYVQHEENQV